MPEAEDFLAVYGVEPLESQPADGYWAYGFEDKYSNRVILSFNAHEQSLQTRIIASGVPLATVSAEGLRRLWLDESEVRAEFERKDLALVLRVSPSLDVRWSLLCPPQS